MKGRCCTREHTGCRWLQQLRGCANNTCAHRPQHACPQLAAWGPAVCGFDLVVSALYSLFAACAAEEQQLQQAGPLQSTAARRGLVNPSELRQALSALPGPQQYRVGECWAGGG